MRRSLAASLIALSMTAALGASTATATASRPPAAEAARPLSAQTSSPKANAKGFQLVGHDALANRGMNAALAIFQHYVYVGSRTDASSGHPHPGVLIVDARHPEHLRTVGEIDGPFEAQLYLTSRELRVIPDQKLLVVLNFKCSSVIHACAKPPRGVKVASNFTFYDISEPAHPRYVSTYTPQEKPHEFFLWRDPTRAGRTLMYYTTPTTAISKTENDTTPANLVVTDVSGARTGAFTELARFNPNDRISRNLRSPDETDASASSAATAVAALVSAGFLLAALLADSASRWLTAFEALAAAFTLVMVFALQHTQTRQQTALQRKLDEILRVLPGADTRLVHVETATQVELDALDERHIAMRDDALDQTAHT